MAVKGIIKELEIFLLPQLNEIKGEIKALDTKIDSFRNELKADIARVEQRVISLEQTLNITKEMEQLKHEVADLKARH